MPNTFFNLTIEEFEKLMKGYKLRKELYEREQAYFISWLLAPHVKKPIAPAQIYGPLQEVVPKKSKDELIEDKEYFLSWK